MLERKISPGNANAADRGKDCRAASTALRRRISDNKNQMIRVRKPNYSLSGSEYFV